MKKLLPLFLLMICFCSCSKKSILYEPSTNSSAALLKTATGAISGFVSPSSACKAVMVSFKLDGEPVNYAVAPGADGSFVFPSLIDGSYTLSFSALPGFVSPPNQTMLITGGKYIDAGTVAFLTAPSGEIYGTIAPIGAASGVLLTTSLNGKQVSYSTLPTNEGDFRFTGIPLAIYTLSFAASESYVITDGTRLINLSQEKPINIGTVTFFSTAGGNIKGTINPIGAASSVSATAVLDGKSISYRSTVGSDGTFRFFGLKPGEYNLGFTLATGYDPPVASSVTVQAGKDTDLGSLTFSVSAQMGSITGIVNRPEIVTGIVAVNLNNIYVRYYAELNKTTGRFAFNRLPAGLYLINYVTSSSQDYYAPGMTNISVRAGQATDIGTVLIANASSCSISGSISPTGSAQEVSATSESTRIVYRTVPNASGNFELTGLPYGKYFVAAVPKAGSGLYAPYRKAITLTNGQRFDLGNILLTNSVPPYPISLFVDGTSYHTQSGLIDSYYVGGSLGINSTLGDYRMIITVDGVDKEGEYVCSPSTKAKATFSKITTPASQTSGMTLSSYSSWSSSSEAAELRIRVTSIDRSVKMIYGTFSGNLTAKAIGGVLSSKSITSGSFAVPYQ